ncbi:MFS transporter [Kitasatospora purpeofusca]|uniref:MFS transporter n=1 Tax=Kitasatospora purpeofusca TaxID=67352 RepID=UPI003243F018
MSDDPAAGSGPEADVPVPGEARAEQPGRHALVVKVWILTGLVAVADFIFGATFVTFMTEGGLSASVIGLLLAGTSVTSLLLEAPSGAWGDRYGHRRLVVGGLTLWGCGLVSFAFSAGAASFATAIGLWSAGLALYSGAASSLLINTLNGTGEKQRGAGAVRGTETIRWGAAAIGAALVALSARTVSTATSIVFSGAVLLCAALWVAVTWPESPRGNALPVWRSLRAGYRLLTRGDYRVLLMLSVLTSADLGIIILTWQPAALTVAGLSEEWLGLSLLVLSMGAAAGAAATRWTSRRDPAVVVCAALIGLNGSLLCLSLGGIGAGAAYLGAEFFVGAALTSLAVWGQQLFPDDLRATATSVLGTATGITIATTHGFVGTLWERSGLADAVSVAAGTLGLSAVVGLLIRPARRAVRPAPPADDPHGATSVPSADIPTAGSRGEGNADPRL